MGLFFVNAPLALKKLGIVQQSIGKSMGAGGIEFSSRGERIFGEDVFLIPREALCLYKNTQLSKRYKIANRKICADWKSRYRPPAGR